MCVISFLGSGGMISLVWQIPVLISFGVVDKSILSNIQWWIRELNKCFISVLSPLAFCDLLPPWGAQVSSWSTRAEWSVSSCSEKTLTPYVLAIKDRTAVFPFILGVLSWNCCTQELLLVAVMSWLGSTTFVSWVGNGLRVCPESQAGKSLLFEFLLRAVWHKHL